MGKNPFDRSKNGTKQSLLVEGDGGPLGVVIAGANVPDMNLLEATIAAIVVKRPDVNEHEQDLCLDRRYDNPTGHDVTNRNSYVPHIRPIEVRSPGDAAAKSSQTTSLSSGTKLGLAVEVPSVADPL